MGFEATFGLHQKRFLIIVVSATNVPMELPIFDIITTASALRKRFLKNLLKLNISCEILLISWTVGFRMVASTRPASQPQARNGFMDVKGAVTSAVRILRGCPSTTAVNRAASPLFHNTHTDNCCSPV